MDSAGKPCHKPLTSDPLVSSVPLFDPEQLPLRDWCTGSREDAVTGLIAFPDFHSQIPRALATALADGSVVGLAIGDVDGLKGHVEQANATEPDSYGHLAGNKVMARLGTTTRSWFHDQPWHSGCAATFGGDEVIITAAVDDATAFYRSVATLRDRLARELPVRVSFALTFASADHLPSERNANAWKHAFTDRVLAAVDRCLFTHKATRRTAGGAGGTLAVTQLPLREQAGPIKDLRTLLPLPIAGERLHVMAQPICTDSHSMLLLPCIGPAGQRGMRLRVTAPDGAARTTVVLPLQGQAAVPRQIAETSESAAAEQPGIPLLLEPIRNRTARGVPEDLAASLERAGLDWSVLPSHEQVQMLHLITESATAEIRTARITAVLDAVATRTWS